ncbi:hypothetical protein LUZ62_081572 [Rhynchospora pubera]|uniref:RNase H type-1 domain-containing protein n=1 Tax=Rhynchospora pubera TaxID=906938 RepID=A0AAV8BY32_9POAL|nr:hypothetical protein LUZ62_081572 [Rhynchospora pubera]
MVWFGGTLGIRTDTVPLNIGDAITYITQGMHEDDIRVFCYTLWEIWLARNEMVFQQKMFDPIAVCRKVNIWINRGNQVDTTDVNIQTQCEPVPYEFTSPGFQVIADASWDASNKTGCAFLVYRDGVLERVGMEKQVTEDPFHAEALTLNLVLHWARCSLQQEDQCVYIFSDCLNLITALEEENMDDIPSWRARPVIASIMGQLMQLRDKIFIRHVRREAVQPAHVLANHARRREIYYFGAPTVLIMDEYSIAPAIDSRYFQQVQERPP